jgi:two-component sensor histidine kinase
MILHELISNAIKYGALSRPEGRVTLVWALGDSDVTLEWVESGLTDVRAPAHRGFGSKMIAISAAHELRGTTATDWRPDGLTFHLTFPVDAED